MKLFLFLKKIDFSELICVCPYLQSGLFSSVYKSLAFVFTVCCKFCNTPRPLFFFFFLPLESYAMFSLNKSSDELLAS